ncbi:hypothetical protein HY407_05290 [Candidatus Gottesmanbacteria bacterium]|nr:hypothetical protein [Candidatus Gottesmanbacteria bacterium]
MGRVSKRRLDREVEERMFEIFRSYLASLTNPFHIEEFMTTLLSYTEKITLAKRFAIAILLNRGHTYEQIDETLKVSKATILGVHRQILIGAPGYQRAYQKILKDKRYEELRNQIEEILLKLSPRKRYGSARWQAKSQAGKSLSKRQRQLSSI